MAASECLIAKSDNSKKFEEKASVEQKQATAAIGENLLTAFGREGVFQKELIFKLFDMPEDTRWAYVQVGFISHTSALEKSTALAKRAKKRHVLTRKEYTEFFAGDGTVSWALCLPKDDKDWKEFVSANKFNSFEQVEKHQKLTESSGTIGVCFCFAYPATGPTSGLISNLVGLSFAAGSKPSPSTTDKLQQAIQTMDAKVVEKVPLRVLPDDPEKSARFWEWFSCASVKHPSNELKGMSLMRVWELQRHICRHCKKTESHKRCTRCKSASYCSKECQQQDWRAKHSKTCVGEAAMAERMQRANSV